jgi:predicted Zn finger-like uncharacterized protein
MIINCLNCNKRFRIDAYLIPVNGRNLKCSSCDHIWFHKIDDKKLETLSLKEDIIDNGKKLHVISKKKEETIKSKLSSSHNKIDNKDLDIISEKKILTENKTKKNTSVKFFSYLIVFIISFVALIILIDTFKIPLINIFPGLEIVLFNLFEMLKDIKLFIIDLY